MSYITCVPWNLRHSSSVKRLCPCGAEIALSSGNVKRVESMGLTPICPRCTVAKLDGGEKFSGGLVDGKVYDLATGFRAAEALRNRN